MATNPSKIRKIEKVADCPACGNAIEATARISVEMLEPTITSAGDTVVDTKSTLEYYHVSHRCPGNPDLQVEAGEPEEPESGEGDDEDSDAAGSED